MNTSKNKYNIAREAIAIKRDMFLNPPKGFLGYKGFEKFIKELPQWNTELDKDDYDKILTNMVMFLEQYQQFQMQSKELKNQILFNLKVDLIK